MKPSCCVDSKTMFKVKKSDKRKRPKKTPLQIEEEQSRTLYVRLPHTIKNVDEVKNLFFGDFKINKPRQSSRHCHVIFSDLEGKIKNFKAVKGKMIGEKPIYIGPPKPVNLEKKMKPRQKKIKMPEPKPAEKINKYLFISNIPPGVKASEVKDAFPGAKTVALLKGLVHGKRLARLKMSTYQLCSYYADNKVNWPVIKDQRVSVRMSKNKKCNKKKKQNKAQSLKVRDGESKPKKDQSMMKMKESDSKNVSTKKSEEDDDSEEEDTDNEKEQEIKEDEDEEEDEDDAEDEDEDEDEEEEEEDEGSSNDED